MGVPRRGRPHFTHGRWCLYWSDLKKLLCRNTHPHSILSFYSPNPSHPNTMTVCDMNLPRRRNFTSFTGWSEADWVMQSMVCVAFYDNGEIPMRGSAGYVDKSGVARGQRRGVLSLIEHLLMDDVLVMTDEIRNFLRENDGLYRESIHRLVNKSNG